MKRSISFFLILAILLSCAVIFSGCSTAVDRNYPVTVGDVTLNSEPKNIVVLNDCVADIISCIGYDEKFVGRSSECDQDYLRIVESVGTPDAPSVDRIVELGADLVIADSSLTGAVRSQLEEAGVTTVVLDPATTPDELQALYTDLGVLLGGNVNGKKKGQKAYAGLMDTLGQFRTSGTGVVKTAVYLYLNDDGQLCTFEKGSLEQTIFQFNGATNVLMNREEALVDASELRLGSPSCIFYDDYAVINYLRNDEQLMHLRALRENKTCQILKENFYRHGVSCEQIVYDMVDFLNRLDEISAEATPDSATPDEYE